MNRGSPILRTARLLITSVATFIIVGIVVLSATFGDLPDDYGVEWHEPYLMSVDEVSTDLGNTSFLITLRLFDAGLRVTEWSGELRLELADEDNRLVYDGITMVRARDFTTTKTNNVVDTRLDLMVPFEDLDHVTDRMLDNAAMDLCVRATFTYGDIVITGSSWWWTSPASFRLQDVYVDEEYGLVEFNLLMFDAEDRTTKWAGDLRLAITDSTGFEMYNSTSAVEAREFNVLVFGRTGWVWFTTWVDFTDMAMSKDRIGDEERNGSGRTMALDAWLTVDGVSVPLDWKGLDPSESILPIPDALLLENQAPTPVLEADRVGLTGRELSFDASGTTDDLGAEGLRYEWSWGDGTLREVTHVPYANHTFARAGSFEVELRVVDLEGAQGRTTADIEVFQDPVVGPDDDARPPILRDRLKDSYLVTRLIDGISSIPR
jgi:hypothetical protein